MLKYITFILGFFFHSVISYAQKNDLANEYVWQNKMGKKAMFKSVNSIYQTPLAKGVDIPLHVLDSIVDRSASYDSALSRFAARTIKDDYKDLPNPNNIYFNGELFVYCGTLLVKFHNSNMSVYCILFDSLKTFTEHGCYKMYYTPKVGPFLVVQQTDEDYFGKSTYYRVVKAKVNSKYVSPALLDVLYKKCINWGYWTRMN